MSKNDPPPKDKTVTKTRRTPLWLRIVLMAALVAVAAAAFYHNNLRIIEYLQER